MRIALALAGLVILAALVGLALGAVALSPGEVAAGLFSPGAPAADIVRQIRLPRVLLAFLVGGSLGVCGAALQALVRNPLADPFLLGISGGRVWPRWWRSGSGGRDPGPCPWPRSGEASPRWPWCIG